MPHFFCSRLFLPVILFLALLPAGEAAAQIDAPSLIDEVDPDTGSTEEEESVYEDEEPTPRRPGKKKGRGKDPEPSEEEEEPEAAVPTPAPPTPAAPAPPTGKPAETPAPTPAPAPPAPMGNRSAPPLLAPRVSDADLIAVWDRWKQARVAGDAANADLGKKALLKLRDEVSASDFDAFSVSLLREARARRDAKDLGGAVRLAEAAATLSPNLPYARFALADLYVRQQPASVGRYSPEIQAGLGALLSDPRYLRPAVADVGAMALLAVLATALAVVAVLFGRRVRNFLHDFHHVFPRGMGKWQSMAVAVTVLVMPLLLGLGAVPVLLVLFAAVVLYLTVAERAVTAVLLALVGLIPLAAGYVARSTVFAGTVAEDVYVLERGGFAGDDAAARVLARHAAKEATFAELYALGRYMGRRGQLEEAETAFKAAAALRQRSGPLLTNYGNVLLAAGKTEEAERIYKEAAQADGTLAAAPYNLAQIYRHRAKGMPDSLVGAEMDRHRQTLATAQLLDSSLVGRDVPPDDRMLVNLLLLSPALPQRDIMELADGEMAGKRVESQLDRLLVGTTGTPARVYPAALALLLFLFGYARDRLWASKACEKCGNVVCRRCDPDLSAGSFMCSQCTNVFARKGVVPEPLREQKQAEVQRHQTWMNRLALALGALVSGAGHIFSGAPVRGALYSFLFLLALSVVVLRDGLLKAPYGDAPVYLKLAPVVLVLLPLYLLSLRGLRKRQTE